MSKSVAKLNVMPLLTVDVEDGQEFVVADREVRLHVREPGVDADEVCDSVVEDRHLLLLNVFVTLGLPLEGSV